MIYILAVYLFTLLNVLYFFLLKIDRDMLFVKKYYSLENDRLKLNHSLYEERRRNGEKSSYEIGYAVGASKVIDKTLTIKSITALPGESKAVRNMLEKECLQGKVNRTPLNLFE